MNFLTVFIPLLITLNSTAKSLENQNSKIGSDVVSETRSVSDFESIEVRGPFRVKLRQGSTFELQIKGTSSLVSAVKTEVTHRHLTVALNHSFSGLSNLELDIQLPRLLQFKQSGAVTTAMDGFTGGSLEIELNGQGALSGSSRFSQMALFHRGHSLLNLSSFEIEHVLLESHGGGQVHLPSIKSLDGKASGAVKIFYPRGQTRVGVKPTGAAQVIAR